MDNVYISQDFNCEEARLWTALLEALEDGQELETTASFEAAVVEGLHFVQQSVESGNATDPYHWYRLRKLAIWCGISARLIQLDYSRSGDSPGSVARFRSAPEGFPPEPTLQIIDHIVENLEASQRIIPEENVLGKLEGFRLLAEAVTLRRSETGIYEAFKILQDAIHAAFAHFWLCKESPDHTPPWLELISALGYSAIHFSDKAGILGTGNHQQHLYREVGLMRSATKLARCHADREFQHQVQVGFSRKLIKLSEYYLAQLADIPPDDVFNNQVCCEMAIKLYREAVALFGDPHENYKTTELGRLRAMCGVRNRASLCRALTANWQLQAVRDNLDEAFKLTTDLFEHVDLDSLGQVMDLKEYHEKTQSELIDHPNYVEHLDRVICVYEAVERLMEAAGCPLRSLNLAKIRVEARADFSTLLRKRFISNAYSALGDITSAIDLLEGVLKAKEVGLPQKTGYHLQLAHCYELKSAQTLQKEDQQKAIKLLEEVFDAVVPQSLSDRCHILIQLARNLIHINDIAVTQKEPGAAEAAILQAIAHCNEIEGLDQAWDKQYRLHMLGQCYRKRFELDGADNIDLLNRSIDYLREALKWGRLWPDRDDDRFEMPIEQDILSFAEEMHASASGPPSITTSYADPHGVYYSNSRESKSLMLRRGDDIALMLNTKMSDWSNAVWNDVASAYESRSRCLKSPDTQHQSDRQEALHFVGKCVNHPKCDLRTRRQAYETASKVHFVCGQWDKTVASSQVALQLTQKLLVRSSSYTDQINASRTQDFTMPQAVAAALLAGRGSDEALRLMEQGRGLFASFPLAVRMDITIIDRQEAFNYLQVRSRFDNLRASLNELEEGISLWITASSQCFRAEKELQEVVSRIHAMQGLLDPPSLADVREVLGDDTLVILNTSEVRCDAFLINNKWSEVQALELCKLKYDEVNLWAQRLRDNCPRVSMSLLSWLWDTVGQPVLQALGFSQPPDEESLLRIHWVLTGRMTQMPVHAAGLYTPEHRGKAQMVMDCAVSSYASSLKMYVVSRTQRQTIKVKKRWTAEEIDAMTQEEWNATHLPNRVFNEMESGYVLLEVEEMDVVAPKAQQKALLVGIGTTSYRAGGRQLEELPFAKTEVEELGGMCKSLFEPDNITVIHQARREVVLDKVSDCTLFHFAGHGYADTTEPSNSGLILEDAPLAVSDLLERKFPGQAPFLGFLSACKTGTSDRAGLEDEGIHLIGAFQLAGFRHVVGTMWQVYDRTCPDVAASLYAEFVQHGITDNTVCRGLHKAVVKLRDKWLADIDAKEETGTRHVSLRKSKKIVVSDGWDSRAKWVPFVHYGP